MEALAAMGGQMAGTIYTNEVNKGLARDANAAAQANSREQMAFQERMSNTAYQRAMDDMKKAGLNPILAYSQGGASTPAGGSGQVTMAHAEDALSKGVSSAIDAKRLRKELDAQDSQKAVNDAIINTQNAQAKLNENNAAVAAKNAKALDAKMPAIEAQAKVDTKRAAYDEKFMQYDQLANRVQQATGVISDATSALLPKLRIGGGDKPLTVPKGYGRTKQNDIFNLETGEIK